MAKSKNKSSRGLHIAAIGASAGGLEALQKLISHIPKSISDVAIVVVQHLSPNYKSMLVESLQGQTTLDVTEVSNGVVVKEKVIYITPPDREITIRNGKFQLSKLPRNHTSHPSINTLFTSLAEDLKEKSVGIILSGTGSDGAAGLKRIEEVGGVTIVQDPRTAKFNSMPQVAIDTVKIDFILTPEKIGERLATIIKKAAKKIQTTTSQPVNKALEDVIELLAREKGTDFTNYKRETLHRRINKRLTELKYTSVDQYFKYLEKNPSEIEELFNTVLIGVTSFFRDPAVYKALEKYIGHLIDSKAANEPIRVWIPGCATGEEAYSIAITILSVLKRKNRQIPVQIFATDISDYALDKARKGVYSQKLLSQVPAEILKAWFVSRNGVLEVSKPVRSMILFSKHDLTHNPPFLKLDLIVCRNLLIYFNTRLQEYVFPVFYSALNPNGYLLLGKSESIGRFNELFTTIRRDAKIFQRKVGRSLHSIRYTPLKVKEIFSKKITHDFSLSDLVKETIYKLFEHAYVVINDAMDIQEIGGDISPYLGLRQGQMNANLISMAHKDLKIELRSLINRCLKEGREVANEKKKFVVNGKDHYVKISIRPLLYSESPNEFYLVIFEEVQVKEESVKLSAGPGKQEIGLIKELELELEATKADLQEIIERYENSNAQLQSLNEELQSANEELKISNEELETANEELQSSNEEINIAYGELRMANEALERQEHALKQSEANIHALLNNTLQAFVLLDKNAHVIAFNEVAVKLMKGIFGNRLSVGDNMNEVMLNPTFRKFYPDFKAAFKGKAIKSEYELADPKGRKYSFVFSFTPVLDVEDDVVSVSFSMLDITELNHTRTELIRSEKLIGSVFHTADIGLAVVDDNGKFKMVNTGFGKLLGYEKESLVGKPYLKVIKTSNANKNNRTGLKGTLLSGKAQSIEYRIVNKEGNIRDVFTTSSLFTDMDGEKYTLLTVRDITEEKKYRELMDSAEKSMHIGSFEFNVDTWQITWTKEMFSLYEVPKGFVPSVESAMKYINKEDLPAIQQAYQNLEEKFEEIDFEFRIITAKRNEKWMHARMAPIVVNSKYVGFRGTMMDISERKYAEMEIERLSWVARHTNNIVIIADRHDRIEWVNDSFESRLGYSLSEINGKIPAKLLSGADTDKATMARIRSRLNDQQPVNEVILLYSRQRIPIWFNLNVAPIFNAGELIHYVGILTDLTELVNAKEIQKNQEALEQRQKLLNAMAGNFPDGIIGVINRNLQYVYVGGTELKKLGHDIKDWIGHELFDKISPEANAYAAPFLDKVFTGESVRFELEVKNNIYSVSAVPMVPEDNLTTKALVVIQNITDRKMAEEETLRALMKQKELNELKSKFVSVASHEFRTPLGTILSSADLVTQYVMRGDQENTQKHIARIKSSVNNLTSILNEFLSLSKIEEGIIHNSPIEFNVREFCENLVEDIQSLKKADQKIIYRCEGMTETIMLDRQHTRNILINLISNALKYSAPGKSIYITSVVEPGFVSFIVKDEGIGIPEEDKGNIYEAFFRAHNATNFQGTGLGLNIIKRYLGIMKGTITFESELNKGTTFKVTLPQASH